MRVLTTRLRSLLKVYILNSLVSNVNPFKCLSVWHDCALVVEQVVVLVHCQLSMGFPVGFNVCSHVVLWPSILAILDDWCLQLVLSDTRLVLGSQCWQVSEPHKVPSLHPLPPGGLHHSGWMWKRLLTLCQVCRIAFQPHDEWSSQTLPGVHVHVIEVHRRQAIEVLCFE